MSAHPTTPTVPLLESIDEIDSAWLEAALGQRHPGTRVSSFSSHPVGAGNVSDTVVIRLDYAEPTDAPPTLVAKFRPRDPDVHAHGLNSGAYHREVGAYQLVSQSDRCRTPELFHVAGDETNINLLIEDLSSATPGSQVDGCGIPEARSVLDQMAGLHATFPMDADAPAWPIRLDEVADYWTEKMAIGAAAAKERYAHDLAAEDLAAISEGTELVHAWHLLPLRRRTLTHGDPRVDNVLFEQTTTGPRAVLIDWQVCGLRNPMYDVGYFMSGSIPVPERRAHEDELLRGYVERFNSISTAPYDLQDARDDFRTQVMSGLIITTAAIAVLPDNDVVNTLILALLRRNCAAVNDWAAIEMTRAATQAGQKG